MDGREARGGAAPGGIGWLLLCGLLAGCATLPGAAGAPSAAACLVEFPTGAEPGAPVPPGWVGVTDPLDPRRAPVGASDMESLLLATLHPLPLRLDCRGHLLPSLVRSWREEEGGRSWRLDTSGPGVDPAEAAARARALAARFRDAAAWEGGAAPLSVELRPPSAVLVRFREPPPDGARTFALPRLAPFPPPVPGSWAAGFGGWVAREEGEAGEREVVLALRPGRPSSQGAGSSDGGVGGVRFRVRPGEDPRAMLDAGAALLLTRDPAVVAWGRRGTGVRVVPLPPDRAYLLGVPGGLPLLSGELRAELAAGIGAEAGVGPRAGADPRGDLSGIAHCPSGAPGRTAPMALPPSPGERRPWIVHPSGDEVARALAERVAALAGPGGHPELRPLDASTGLRVVPLDGDALEHELRSGRAVAYILPTPARPPAPCREWEALRAGASWIAGPGATHLLAETGAVALLRAGAPPLEVDGSGAIRLLLPPSAP